MSSQLDAVYEERNRVVAALAQAAVLLGYPVLVTKTQIEGWDAEWHNCVFIDLPTGQVSWHFHDREVELFRGIPTDPWTESPWDGHTTEEKYQRLDAFAGGSDD